MLKRLFQKGGTSHSAFFEVPVSSHVVDVRIFRKNPKAKCMKVLSCTPFVRSSQTGTKKMCPFAEINMNSQSDLFVNRPLSANVEDLQQTSNSKLLPQLQRSYVPCTDVHNMSNGFRWRTIWAAKASTAQVKATRTLASKFGGTWAKLWKLWAVALSWQESLPSFTMF